jgi:adenine-specific DNA methylase
LPILEFEDRAVQLAATRPSLLCDLAERGSLLAPPPDNDHLSRALRETNSRLQKHSLSLLATTYFGGAYFSYRQALDLDCLLAAIEQVPAPVRDTCLATVLSTASMIVNSVGKQFAQPMRPRRKDGTVKLHVVKQMCRDRSADAAAVFSEWLARYRQLPQKNGHLIVRGDYRDVLRELTNVDVVYADPPYTRDHYSRFYHVLETLSLRDSPSISTTSLTGKGNASRGIYREHRHQSPFCIKSQAPNAFDELFRGCRQLGAAVLVSYSPFLKGGHPRLMAIEAVQQIAKAHYRHVRVESAQPLAHSKLNKSELHLDASANAEVFIICQN